MADIKETGSKRNGAYRAALAAVIILSVLLVLAFVGVVVGELRQYHIYLQAKPAPAKDSK